MSAHDIAPYGVRAATAEEVRADTAALMVAHGYVRSGMSRREVKFEVDLLLAGVTPEIRGEVLVEVLNLI